MKCKRVNELYDLYQRGMLTDRSAEQVEEHLAACDGCRQAFEDNETLRLLIREASDIPETRAHYYHALAARALDEIQNRSGWRQTLAMRWREAAAAFKFGLFRRELVIGTCCLVAGICGAMLWLADGTFERVETVERADSASLTDDSFYPPLRIAHFDSGNSLMSSPFTIDKGIQDEPAPLSELELLEAPARGDSGERPTLVLLDGQTLIALSHDLVRALSNLPSVNDRQQNSSDAANSHAPAKLVSASGTVAQSAQPSNSQLISAFDRLEDVKWKLYQDGFLDEYQTIRNVTRDISDVPEIHAPSEALSVYHQAEDAVVAGRYFDALQQYQRVMRKSPDTMIAALSRFRMAEIHCELGDFETAFNLYKECIHSDGKYLTAERSDIILQRIQMIADNSVDNYRPLRLYFQGKQAPSYDAVDAYQELLERYPTSSLAENAIADLRDRVIYPEKASKEPPISADRTLQILNQFQSIRGSDQVAIQAQMALADIIFYRLQDPERARFEYGRIFDMTDNPDILTELRAKIKNLAFLDTLNE